MMTDRYTITIKDGHDGVRLRDNKTGEAHVFTGRKALYDALGVLADWRDRDQAHKEA